MSKNVFAPEEKRQYWIKRMKERVNSQMAQADFDLTEMLLHLGMEKAEVINELKAITTAYDKLYQKLSSLGNVSTQRRKLA